MSSPIVMASQEQSPSTNINHWAYKAGKQRQVILKRYQHQFDGIKKNAQAQLKAEQPLLNQIMHQRGNQRLQSKWHQPPPALLFISFSLPKKLLKQYIAEGAHYHIPLVVRGLYHNNFKQTVQKIFQLTKKTDRGGILIDPLWFETFSIHAVPALVMQSSNSPCQAGKACSQKNFDVIYGALPLKKALTVMIHRGSVAQQAAQTLLKRYGNGQ